MKTTKLTAIAATILIAGLVLYGLFSLFGLTSIKHESDIIKNNQVPLYITKADAGDYDAASALYFYYKNISEPEYALHWLRIAANGGGESPNEWLLDTLAKSPNKKHQEEAVALLRKLADEGRAPFQMRFGEEIMRDVRINSDAKLAMSYFASSAKQGYKPAIIKYVEILAGSVDAPEDRINAMIWIMVARLCFGDDYSGRIDSIEKSISTADASILLELKKNDINRSGKAVYSSIINYTKNHNEFDFRYCGIER